MTATHSTKEITAFQNLIADLTAPPAPPKDRHNVDLGSLASPPNNSPIVWQAWATAKTGNLLPKIHKNATHLLINKGLERDETIQVLSELTLDRLLDNPIKHARHRSDWQIVNYSSWRYIGQLDKMRRKLKRNVKDGFVYSLDDLLVGKDGQPMEEPQAMAITLANLDYRLDKIDLLAAFDALEQENPDRAMAARLNLLIGLPPKDIADRLEIPFGTAKSHVLRAKKTLRELLADIAPQDRTACPPYYLGRGYDKANPSGWDRETEPENIVTSERLPDLDYSRIQDEPIALGTLAPWQPEPKDRTKIKSGPSKQEPPHAGRQLDAPASHDLDPAQTWIIAESITTRQPCRTLPAVSAPIPDWAETKDLGESIPAITRPSPGYQNPPALAAIMTAEISAPRTVDAMIAARLHAEMADILASRQPARV